MGRVQYLTDLLLTNHHLFVLQKSRYETQNKRSLLSRAAARWTILLLVAVMATLHILACPEVSLSLARECIISVWPERTLLLSEKFVQFIACSVTIPRESILPLSIHKLGEFFLAFSCHNIHSLKK